MKNIIIVSILGIVSILLVEYSVQQKKSTAVSQAKIVSQVSLIQQNKKQDPDNKPTLLSNENTVVMKAINLVQIDKEIATYNKQINEFKDFKYEQFTQAELELFSKLNLERAKLLREKVLAKYKEQL